MGEVVTTIPTIGFNVETVKTKNIAFTTWDVGGPDKIRPLWRYILSYFFVFPIYLFIIFFSERHYLQNAQAFTFVVDSNDRERIDEAALEFSKLLREDDLQETVVLIFCNKQDLPNAMSPEEVTYKLGLKSICKYHRWFVQPCCAISGDGINEGFIWVSQQLSRRK